MSQINEFGINLPMVGIPPMTSPEPAPHDCTAQVSLPAEIDPMQHSHISVYAEGCPQINTTEGSSMISMDLVLNVSISNPVTGTCSTYKIVKRLSMDKIKLAHQAELETPFQVVEGEAVIAARKAEEDAAKKKLAESQAAARARELAGLPALVEAA